MSISQTGLNLIAKWEGFRSQKYRVNGKGNWTIGYGHEIRRGENFSGGITKFAALNLLRKDALGALRTIQRLVKVSLSQNQLDALVSYVFNTGSLYGTRLLRNLNNRDFKGAAREMDINTQGGKFVQGLQNRREEEQKIFLS